MDINDIIAYEDAHRKELDEARNFAARLLEKIEDRENRLKMIATRVDGLDINNLDAMLGKRWVLESAGKIVDPKTIAQRCADIDVVYGNATAAATKARANLEIATKSAQEALNASFDAQLSAETAKDAAAKAAQTTKTIRIKIDTDEATARLKALRKEFHATIGAARKLKSVLSEGGAA